MAQKELPLLLILLGLINLFTGLVLYIIGRLVIRMAQVAPPTRIFYHVHPHAILAFFFGLLGLALLLLGLLGLAFEQSQQKTLPTNA